MGYFSLGGVRVNSCKQWLACLRVGEETPRVFLIQGRGINSSKIWLVCLRVGEQTPVGYFFLWGEGESKVLETVAYLRVSNKLQWVIFILLAGGGGHFNL